MNQDNPFFDSFSNDDQENSTSTSNSNTSSNTSNFPNNKTNKKYYIKDNYWFINMKLFQKEKLDKDEVAFLTISFNSQYDNLRISFLEPSNETFTESCIIRSKAKLLTTVNVFSETCEAVCYYWDAETDKNNSILSLERVIQENNSWKPNKTRIELDKDSGKITLSTINSNDNKYKFVFDKYQTTGFLNVCKFMTRGNSWIISNFGQFII